MPDILECKSDRSGAFGDYQWPCTSIATRMIEPIWNAGSVQPTANAGNAATGGEKCITPLQSDARVGMLPQDLKGVA